MTENSFDQERALSLSAFNILNSSKDLNALCDSISEAFHRTSRKWSVDEGEDESHEINDWITASWAQTLVLRDREGRRNSKPIGSITYLVRLCGLNDYARDNPEWPWLGQACVIVAWQTGTSNGWAIGDFEPDWRDCIFHRGYGLWAWNETEGSNRANDDAHFFVLPVFSLHNENDIAKFVLKPFEMLFSEDDPHKHAVKALDSVPVLLPTSNKQT